MNRARLLPVVLMGVTVGAVGLAAFATEPKVEDAPKAEKKEGEPKAAKEIAPKSEKKASPKVDEKDLEHARTTVKMLDDVYKTAIVLITDKYVHTETDFPAGSAAVAWFAQINKKGWQTVRLIDATGDPYDPENVAKSDFEKDAIKKLKRGKTYVEKVVAKGDGAVLLAATPVPVVMEKCVMCHPHYGDVKEGEAIGAITYEIPIR